MISHVLLVALLASQANLAPARTAYSKCLGSLTKSAVKERVEPAAFEAKLAEACKAEEAAFRAASVATDVAAKIARATAERNATDEIGYIRENALETFKTYIEDPKPN
jgi:hypothetical protein